MKKNKPLIIGGIVVVVLAAAYMLFGRGSMYMGGEIKKGATQSGEEFVGKLKEVIAKGVPMKCEYKNQYVSGTSYIKGKKVYSEMVMDGKKASVVIKDNCMWNWSMEEPQGMKTCFEEDIFDMGDEAQGANMEGEYRCRPDSFSDSKFNLPANVNFMDIDSMMDGQMMDIGQ